MRHLLNESNSILNQYLAELRDEHIQQDMSHFRRNLYRCGEIFAYEISKNLEYTENDIVTPLGVTKVPVPSTKIVIASILRAGLSVHEGMLHIFDRAESAFISISQVQDAEADEEDDAGIKHETGYFSSPDMQHKILIIVDALIGTGNTMLKAYKSFINSSQPKHVHIVSLISSEEGYKYLKKNLPVSNVNYWFGAIDTELTAKSFIVPGLGNAGELSFGAVKQSELDDEEEEEME